MTEKYTATTMNTSEVTPASSAMRGLPMKFLVNIQGDTAMMTTGCLPDMRTHNYKKVAWIIAVDPYTLTPVTIVLRGS